MRTDDKLTEICDNLRTQYGDVHKACRMSGVSVDFLFNWTRDDKVAADAIAEAKRVGHLGLVSAMTERGVHGVQKAVYYKGQVVGYDTQYSDGLLVKLAEAFVPEFNKKDGANNQFNGPTQINIMPRAETYDQWLAMRDKTLERRARDALPAPKVPEVLQGDYVVAERPLAGLEGLL